MGRMAATKLGATRVGNRRRPVDRTGGSHHGGSAVSFLLVVPLSNQKRGADWMIYNRQ